MTRGRARAQAVAVLGALALALAACAPPPRPGGLLEDVAQRYGAARARRAAVLRAYTAQVVLRLDGTAVGRLPAVAGAVALGTPDRVRLVATPFPGVEAEVLLARDTLWAWLPGQGRAFALPQDSLPLAAPGALVAQVLGATWDPPAAAWRAALVDSAGCRLGWREGEDSLALALDAHARPVRAWRGRGGNGIAVRYTAWRAVAGEALPERCELGDDAGAVRLRMECEDMRARDHAGADWFRPRRDVAPRELRWDDLRDLLTPRGGTP